MLHELVIEKLALFERATLHFGLGLNVVTGETGAGKSLLVGALELLLGERPRGASQASIVRKGAQEARVEGRFQLAPAKARARELSEWLAANLPLVLEEWSKLPADEDRELILGRTVSAEGRSRAWVDQRPVTAKILRELSALLVEIHGQNEHQKLLDPAEQRRLLDAFGELEPLLEAYRAQRARAFELEGRLARFESETRERRDRLDLLRYQARELAEARLSADEPRELEREREVLRHAAELATQLGALTQELREADPSALDLLRRALRVLETWENRIAALAAPAESMRAAVAHLEEAAAGVARFQDGLESSPERLEEVEARLYELEKLEKKYRTDVAGLVALERAISAELGALDAQDVDETELAAQCERARSELEAAAAKLSQARRGLRKRLVAAVHRSLVELGLERAVFDVRIEPRAAPDLRSPNAPRTRTDELARLRRYATDGADDVEFFLSANPGEEPQPLRAVASGGEAARIMLALRTALALRQTIPTLVFDEVDAGVGGRLGPKVGEHLRALASGGHQILCVTHLPAIAALAHRHFKVEKHVAGGRTRTEVVELAGEPRVEEVADMIAGGAAHATARAEARRLLAQ